MAVISDVGIAVTLEVDKLMRETLNAIAHGHEAIEMLDSMFVREQDGWKLYHNSMIRWYTENDDAVSAVHNFLTAAVDGDFDNETNYQECITYIVLTPESLPEGAAESHGFQDDPFNLGYSFSLKFDAPPTTTEKT